MANMPSLLPLARRPVLDHASTLMSLVWRGVEVRGRTADITRLTVPFEWVTEQSCRIRRT